MKIFITGGTGFIGSKIVETCSNHGHDVSILTRNASIITAKPHVNVIEGNPLEPGKWQQQIITYDVVINLAGASIFRLWTASGKEQIRSSRLKTTAHIVKALSVNRDKHILLINASGVGYYGFCGDEIQTEHSPAGKDFLASLAADWEASALQARSSTTRVLLCRFGNVLGRNGGMLPYLTTITRLGMGSPWGNGTQWFSWIHITDLVNTLMYLLQSPIPEGPINVTSPEPVRNHELVCCLRKILNVSSFIPSLPSWLLKLLTGEFASVFLTGQRAEPTVLQKYGYRFLYPSIFLALSDLILRRTG